MLLSLCCLKDTSDTPMLRVDMVQGILLRLLGITIKYGQMARVPDGRGVWHVQDIRQQKLQQLEQAGVPAKYHAQLARKVFAT